MIRFDKLLTASAAVALAMGTAAIAQTYGGDPNQAPPAASDPGAPSAGMAGSDVNATVPQSTAATADGGAQYVQQGSNTLVTNGPVPDTPANRARYGRPMSRAGRHTAPAGN
ncbi:MAG TPA: hypothetical protein VG248_14190 [Caulobacteraceae bacterium]|jgi:hypothetical protein|nr:hypothetical protein [Caulobacteraceae bacterium]